MSSDSSKVIYFHIPKTGGTTLRSIIKRQYNKEEVFEVKVHPHLIGSIKKFIDLTSRKNLSCVVGHIPYGVSRYLDGDYKRITIVRSPIKRVISYYYFSKTTDSIENYGVSLREFVGEGYNPEVENGMTKQLSGKFSHMIAGNKRRRYNMTCSKDDFRRAKKNINTFDFVGFTSEFDKSLIAMSYRYGWSNISYARGNTNKSRPSIKEIDEKTISLIRDRNKYDIKLYKYAKENLRNSYRINTPDMYILRALSQIKTSLVRKRNMLLSFLDF